jgi:hypothetical protein
MSSGLRPPPHAHLQIVHPQTSHRIWDLSEGALVALALPY